MLRLVADALRSALLAASALALAGVVAGAVRVLPWLIDPAVPWAVAAPFARGLAAVAFEAALLVGWPVGWALACLRFVERGEARVMQTLGEPPGVTVGRLAPQGAALALVLASVAFVYGRDASAPGHLATELVARARIACASARGPATYAIPFTDFTWLCAPGRQPRLVGTRSGVGPMASAVVTARGARIAGDFRSLELDDARVLFLGAGGGAGSSTVPVALHVGSLSIRGLSPWAQASSVSPALRALVLAWSAASAACVGAYLTLRGTVRSRIGVFSLGAAAPLADLALFRLFERASFRPLAFVLIPFAGTLGAVAVAAGVTALRRLRDRNRAASTVTKV